MCLSVVVMLLILTYGDAYMLHSYHLWRYDDVVDDV